MKKCIVLVLSFLFANVCFAMPKVDVSFIATSGVNGLTCDEAMEAFKDVQKIYKEQLRINLNLRWTRCMKNRGPVQTLNNRLTVLNWWKTFFSVPGRNKGTRVLHFALLNPIKEGDTFWLAGYAIRVCAYKRTLPVALSNGELQNALGLPRYKQTVIGMCHESGHLLGADHDDDLPVTIMNPDPLPHVPEYEGWMPFSSKSKRQIRSCMR